PSTSRTERRCSPTSSRTLVRSGRRRSPTNGRRTGGDSALLTPGDPSLSRPVPVPTDDDRAFWTGGADRQLLIHRCTVCRQWFHPPAPVCPRCRTRDVQPEPASGRGTVWAATVNHQSWFAALPPPY